MKRSSGCNVGGVGRSTICARMQPSFVCRSVRLEIDRLSGAATPIHNLCNNSTNDLRSQVNARPISYSIPQSLLFTL